MSEGVAAHYLRMPRAEKGMSVGLFGGSFNPPHGGHLLLAEIALRRLNLDQLWWIVTPGNPLKDKRELAPLSDRLAACEVMAEDPRIKVTAFEAGYNVRYTADTLAIISARNTGVNFVWLMGADNLKNFDKWQRWHQIAMTYPIAVIDRPGSTLSFLSSKLPKPSIMPARMRMTRRRWPFTRLLPGPSSTARARRFPRRRSEKP